MTRANWRLPVMLLAAIGSLAAAGCGKSEARFRLNMVAMHDNNVTEAQQQQIADILTAMFGTPDDPYLPPDSGLDLAKIQLASGPVHRDAVSGPRGLYREHCIHCHGTSGDGMGPTAAFLNPYPRDYRYGWFKFKSTRRIDRPTSDDLLRVVTDGLQGSYMPSFKLLPQVDREALVEYVRYLSMRGETELALAADVKENLSKEASMPTDADYLKHKFAPIAEAWKEPIPIAVADRPEDMQFDLIADPVKRKEAEDLSKEIGRQMFMNENPGKFPWTVTESGQKVTKTIDYVGAACSKCHGPTALGDGQTTGYDDWTLKAWGPKGDRPASEVLPLGVLPERHIIPRNLRQGVYRGGRRPLDFYYRVHEGIEGTPMPQTPLLTQQEKDQIEKLTKAAERKAKKNPEFQDVEDDPEQSKMNLHKRAEFVAKLVDPELEKIERRRIWNLVDYIQSLPYQPGGELGADAAYTQTEEIGAEQPVR